MKKSLLAIFALAAMTASATSFMNYNRVYTPAGKAHFVESATVAKTAKAPQKIANVDELVGEYIGTFNDMTGGFPGANSVVVSKGKEVGTIIFEGLYGPSTDKVVALVDAANNKFTIAPGQTVYTSQDYGACNMFKVISYDDTKGANLDKAANIEGTINNGVITFTTPWAAVIANGKYAGYYLTPIASDMALVHANGKMDYTNSKGKAVSSNVLITEKDDSVITVANYGDFGVIVEMIAKKDSTVNISKQNVLDGGDTQGIFYTTDVTGTNASNAQLGDGNISCTGKGHPNQIMFTEQWTFYTDKGYWFGINKNTKIYFTNNEVFKYPYEEPSAVTNVVTGKTVAGTTYVNLAGVQSNEPFEGVNIVVTRYTDGSMQAKKVMK